MKISIKATDVKNHVGNIQFERTFAHLAEKYMSSHIEAQMGESVPQNCANVAKSFCPLSSVLH